MYSINVRVLCAVGEASGKASKGTAKTIPGASAMARANSEAAGSVSEIGRAKMAAVERGEKLSELDERTAQMAIAAQDYASHASALANKYRDRKWYQF